jgi:hypothetical protein
MARMTRKISGSENFMVDAAMVSCTDGGCSGEAIDRLARFENLVEEIAASQVQISRELADLRNQGRSSSVKFRELMVQKLTNNHMLVLFNFHGLT